MALNVARLILVLILFVSVSANSADVGSDVGAYENALKLYQEQKYTAAEAQFRDFAGKNPNNKFAFYNWGLAAYQSGARGLAVAAWRRTLTLDPDFSPALAGVRFAKTEMPSAVFAATANRWEELRSAVLERTTLDRFFGLTLLFLLSTGALGIRYFGARHRALRDELPLPPFPSVGAFLAACLIVSASLTVAKFFADREERATVVKAGVSVRSGPSEQDNTLFEIIEGIQVIVRQENSGWTMITYPGGLSGWVPSESLFITSRKD